MGRHKIKRFLHIGFTVGLAACYASFPAYAQISASSVNAQGLANEYFVGKDFGRPLISVNLMSGVTHPGVYHIPVGTNLVELVSYAGGTVERAALDDIAIRRPEGATAKIEVVDLKHSFREREPLTQLLDGDSVQIPVNQTLDRTLMWVLIVSGVLSASLSAALINQANHNR